MRKSEKIVNARTYVFIALAALATISVTYFYWFVIENNLPLSKKPSDWAQFGSYLAGLAGPSLSFISILILIATLRSQQQELNAQREQISIQAFEQSFFSLLRSYQESLSRLVFISTTSGVSKKNGPDALLWLLSDFSQPQQNTKNIDDFTNIELEDPADVKLFITKYWNNKYREYEVHLKSITHLLFSLISWVNSHSNLSPRQKWNYIVLIRNHLTSPELRVIYLYNFFKENSKQIHLINKYALFDDLDITSHTLTELCNSLDNNKFKHSAFDAEVALRQI